MAKATGILIAFLFGFVSVKAFAIEPRIGVDVDLYQKFVCRGKNDGVKLLVPGSCTQYYECQSNESILKTCESPTKYYDSEFSTCVSTTTCIEDMKDCGDRPITPRPPTTQPPPCKTTTSTKAEVRTTPEPTTPEPTTPKPTTPEPTTPAPTTPAPTTPSPTTPSPTTAEPTTPTPTTPTTSAAKTEATSKKPLRPCQEHRHQQELEFLEQLKNPNFFGEHGRPCETPGGSCHGVSDGSFIANKNNCTKYKICFNGCGLDIYCPRGKHFNEATRQCDKPENAMCKY